MKTSRRTHRLAFHYPLQPQNALSKYFCGTGCVPYGKQVATQLGLLDDAVRLYRECGRYDLLNRLYQAAGLWERALEVAEANDGINLSTTHQLYAQHLEKVRFSRAYSTLDSGTSRFSCVSVDFVGLNGLALCPSQSV